MKLAMAGLVDDSHAAVGNFREKLMFPDHARERLGVALRVVVRGVVHEPRVEAILSSREGNGTQGGGKLIESILSDEELAEFLGQGGVLGTDFVAIGRLPGLDRLEVSSQDVIQTLLTFRIIKGSSGHGSSRTVV